MQQTLLPFHHATSYLEQDLLVSEANQDAYTWVMRDTQDWAQHGVLIWGEQGCGKTHLAHIWAQHHQAIFLDRHQIERILSSAELPESFWVLDDVDLWLRASDEHPPLLFHLLNIVFRQDHRLLLTAHTPVNQWSLTLADLSSRLLTLPSIAIAQPDDDLLSMLWRKSFSDRQLQVPEEVITYLLLHCDRDFHTITRIAELIDKASMRQKRNISLSLTRQVLNDATLRHF